VSHKPDGRLPLLSARPAVTLAPFSLHYKTIYRALLRKTARSTSTNDRDNHEIMIGDKIVEIRVNMLSVFDEML